MRNKKSRILIILGCCCILAAAALYSHNSWESSRAGKESSELTDNFSALLERSQEAAAQESAISDPILDELMDVVNDSLNGRGQEDEPEESPVESGPPTSIKTYNINDYNVMGSLSVPSVGIHMAIIAQWSYDNLRVSACRYSGTADTQMVILGHSYASHFGPLTGVAQGDSVTYTDVDGSVYAYEVTAVETIHQDNLAEIVTGDWDLTLFTCNYTGESRICVRCDLLTINGEEPVEEAEDELTLEEPTESTAVDAA